MDIAKEKLEGKTIEVATGMVMKGLFVHECVEGSQCSRKTLCVWGNVLASGERGFQE